MLLREMRHHSSRCSKQLEVTHARLGSYRGDSVSLRFDQGVLRRVETMLDDDVKPFIEDFENRMLLSSSELGAVLQNTENAWLLC